MNSSSGRRGVSELKANGRIEGVGSRANELPAARPPLPILTSLRFFAAAEVVIFHFPSIPFIPMDFLRGLTSAGYQAVTFFFVLSGFILTYVYTGREKQEYITVSAREFWRARIARILPAYILGLILLLPAFIYSALIAKIASIETFILGMVLVPSFLQAWWPPLALIWNKPAWSLSVEVLFYAIFPILPRATTRLGRNYLILMAFGLVIVIVTLRSFITHQTDYSSPVPWQSFVLYFPLFHLPQFIFGYALGRLYLFGPAISPKIHAIMLCAGAIGLLLVFGYRLLLPWWTHTDAALVLLFGLIIFGGARAENALNGLASPFILLMGEASYSIYILHVPIWFWWDWTTRKILRSSLPALLDFAIYFGLVIVASVLCYLYVEKPMRRWILGHREHRSV